MPNISGRRLMELERAEKRLQELLIKDSIGWVGVKLGEVMATRLACTAYSHWKSEEKNLLRAVCGVDHGGQITAYRLYIDRLPKESEDEEASRVNAKCISCGRVF